jgi:hypothetical protein
MICSEFASTAYLGSNHRWDRAKYLSNMEKFLKWCLLRFAIAENSREEATDSIWTHQLSAE